MTAQHTPPSEQHHLSHPKYRADIDGLRAIAVLSVVGFHAFPDWARGGFVGVDIFFVISGFLISSIIFGSLAKDSFSFQEFYARRIKRIFPALIVVMTFCFIFGWFILLPHEYKQLSKHIIASGTFLSNFAFWREAGYFNNAADTKPLLHIWSLGIEEQFYIIWPLILYFAWKKKLNLLLLAAAIAISSFILNVAFINVSPIATFYLPVTRFWELLLGSILGYITLNGISLWGEVLKWSANPLLGNVGHSTPHYLEGAAMRNFQSLFGFFLIVLAIVFIDKYSAFPGWLALLPTVGTCLIISAGRQSWFNRVVLSHRVIVWFGLISYPLYLWHWPLLSFAHIVDSGKVAPQVRTAAVLIAIALAWLTYQYVEKKIRFRKERIVTVMLLLICSTIIVTGGLAWKKIIHPRHHNPQLEMISAAIGDWDYPPSDFEVFRYEGINFFTKKGTEKKVLFIGDSNIEQYAPRIDELLSEKSGKGKYAIFATAAGCPPIPHVLEDAHKECEATLASATKLALSADIDTVVIGACWWCYFIEEVKPDREYNFYFEKDGQKLFFKNGNGVSESLKSLSTFLKLLASQKKVFLVLNTPAGPGLDPKNLVGGSRLGQLFYKPNTNLSFGDFVNEYGPIRGILRSIGEQSGVTVVDPLDYLCAVGVCPATMPDGRPIYRDQGHISASYSRYFTRYIDVTVE